MGKKKFKTSEEMFPLVKAYLEGEKSRADFCFENGIKQHVLNYWLSQYRKNQSQSSVESKFAKITVVEPSLATAQEITIQCANGVIIKIPM